MKATLAFFFIRFKALVIDIFMIYIPILYITTYVVLDGKEDFQHSQFAIFICFLLYAVIDSLFCSTLSQTPGMKAQDLVLKTKNGGRISFWVALLRFVLFCASFALLFGFIFPFLRHDKKTFHDFICKTIVHKIQN